MPTAPPHPAPHRRGEPNPLIFHLGSALAGYGTALLAAPRADSPSFPWADGLGESARRICGDLDQMEVALEIAARLRATVAGLEIWQTHPYRRSLADPPAIWQDGCSRLLDYGAAPEAADPDGAPFLVIPSLVNRAYVLDLIAGRSLLRWLASQGLRPLLLDWGTPGPAESDFDLDAYGRARLLPALAEARGLAGGAPVPVLGYCMGGTLATGLAARRPDAVSALVTIGAPWDFASPSGIAGAVRALIRAGDPKQTEAFLDHLGAAFGNVPVDLLQMIFALINPIQSSLKFQKLARLDPEGAAARLFVAFEDWLADGVPMPAGAAKDLLVNWQIRNQTATGQWRFLGGRVDPGAVTAPALVFAGERDTIAPPPTANALGAVLPGAEARHPRTGHVGMIVGSAARSQVWRPAAAFLAAHAGHARG
jgi:polyhydroxyalkanoate synthase